MDADALVDDYLGRLDAAAARLPVDRRAELVGEVREHIATALAEAGRRDELTVRNVLERLGSPAEIVAAEAAPDAIAPAPGSGPAPEPIDGRPPWGANETAAVLLLTVGAVVLPFVGPLVGLVLVWFSARWTRFQKSLVTVIVVTIFVVLPIIGLSVWGMNVGQQSFDAPPIIEESPIP